MVTMSARKCFLFEQAARIAATSSSFVVATRAFTVTNACSKFGLPVGVTTCALGENQPGRR